ncbi:MAG: diadenylate cyclase [Candidatus Omnitrophota bacterium]|jgi:diadenylate cyclase
MNLTLTWIKQVGVTGFLDIFLLALVIYSILVWFKRTKASAVLTGIIIVAGAYLLMRQFNLVMTAILFEKFFAVILIAMVVIFQEELKSFFEQVARWSTIGRSIKGQRKSLVQISRQEVEVLVRTITDLAKEKIGALIVIKGKESLGRHLSGGVDLGGRISEPILKSIF